MVPDAFVRSMMQSVSAMSAGLYRRHHPTAIFDHTLTDRERYARLYSGSRWQRTRDQAVRRMPLCARCELRITEIVDHVVPAGVAIAQAQASGLYQTDHSAGFFFGSNLQGLCRSCHLWKTIDDKAHIGPWPDVVDKERATPKRRFNF